jgi:hypothetical protein
MTSAEPVKALPGWSEAATKGIEGTDSQDELRNLIAKAKQRLKQLESGSGAVNQMEDLGRRCSDISKRRKTSNDEKDRESSSDEKCTKSSSDEKQADIAIEGGNFSMIIFSALQGYTTKGVDRGFEVYRNNLQDTGAEQLERTRHTAYYIPFDGVESGMEILFYVSHYDRTYPQYITEKDMHGTQ